MNDSNGERLIQELLVNPKKFNKLGKAYDLLQEYFNGMPLETLRELLKNSNEEVKHAGVWIASELGKNASEIVDDVIPLASVTDRYIKYHALETIMVCSFEERSEDFLHVIHALNSGDRIIRVLAMRLLSNASELQLQAGIRIFEGIASSDKSHSQGLSTLLNQDINDSEVLRKMIDDSNPITRKYGVIAAKRFIKNFPNLITYAASSSDIDVNKFSNEVIEMDVD